MTRARLFQALIALSLLAGAAPAQQPNPPQPMKTAAELARVQVAVGLTPEARRVLGGSADAVVRAFEAALARVDMGSFAPGSPSRFLIAVDVQQLFEDVTPTAPPLVAVRARVSARFGDRISGRAFAEFSREVAVTGRTRELAYRSLGNRLRLDTDDWREAARQANTRIIAYFETQCEAVLGEAHTMVQQEAYENALVALTSIPREARTCHARAQQQMAATYRSMQDGACQRTFARARARWAASPNPAMGLEIADSLGGIPPGSSCDAAVEALLGDVVRVIATADSSAATRERDEFGQRKREYEDALAVARLRAQNDAELRTGAQQLEYAVRMAGIEMAGRVAVGGALKQAAANTGSVPTFEFRP